MGDKDQGSKIALTIEHMIGPPVIDEKGEK
jgi:hypothetical protein